MDPDKIETGTESADGAAAAATESEAPAVPQTDAEKASMMREAMSAVGGGDEEAAPADKPAEGAEQGEEQEGEEAAAGDEGQDAGDDGQEDPAAAEKAAADAEHTKSVDAEVKSLGLKGKTEERFRELANTAREGTELRKAAEPLLAVAEKEGVPVSQLIPYMIQRTERAQEWEDKVMSTGATPDQFGRAMAAIAAVNSDDPVVLGNLRTVLVEELAFVDERLGRKTEKFNPLDQPGNEDLKQDVEVGEMSESRALELAALRLQGKKQVETRTKAGEQVVQQNQAVQDGVAAVRELGTDLRELDPENFDAKMKQIAPLVRKIQAEKAPSEWAGEIKELYKKTKVVKAPSRVTRIPAGPRGAAPSDTVAKVITDPLEALRSTVRAVEAKTSAR